MKTFKYIPVAVVALAASCAFAEAFPEGYLTDTRGNVVRTDYRECVHTGYWTPAMAIAECDPGLVKKTEPPKEPPKPPAVVPEKPAPPPKAIRFSAETLFDFDRAVVKPEGRKILDEKIVTGMKLRPEEQLLTITGHADRIGTEKYNQALSERRANAVKAYLEKQGINADRMSASGKGETEPDLTANTAQTCRGMRGKALIACLQPDRRVTVESAIRQP